MLLLDKPIDGELFGERSGNVGPPFKVVPFPGLTANCQGASPAAAAGGFPSGDVITAPAVDETYFPKRDETADGQGARFGRFGLRAGIYKGLGTTQLFCG